MQADGYKDWTLSKTNGIVPGTACVALCLHNAELYTSETEMYLNEACSTNVTIRKAQKFT